MQVCRVIRESILLGNHSWPWPKITSHDTIADQYYVSNEQLGMLYTYICLQRGDYKMLSLAIYFLIVLNFLMTKFLTMDMYSLHDCSFRILYTIAS